MKLKTNLHPESGFPIFFCAPQRDVYHDAAYAHALVMAMDWYIAQARHGHVAEAAVSLIKKRADELMREWGYHE